MITLTDNIGWTPLHDACSQGNLDIVKCIVEFLIKTGQKDWVNKTDEERNTPFYYVCKLGQGNVVEHLLNHELIDIDL